MVETHLPGQVIQPMPALMTCPRYPPKLSLCFSTWRPDFWQALIYTAVVHALVAAERQIASWIGEWHAFGKWGTDSELVAAVMSALVLGLVVATTTNHDLVHMLLRKWRVTHRTSHPGEWFSALSENSQAVVLHLKDETEIHGWPSMWPHNAEKGHFFVTGATRRARGKDNRTSRHEALVINVVDVSLVELAAP